MKVHALPHLSILSLHTHTHTYRHTPLLGISVQTCLIVSRVALVERLVFVTLSVSEAVRRSSEDQTVQAHILERECSGVSQVRTLINGPPSNLSTSSTATHLGELMNGTDVPL